MPMHGSRPVPDRWAALGELILTRHLHCRRVLEVGSVRVPADERPLANASVA